MVFFILRHNFFFQLLPYVFLEEFWHPVLFCANVILAHFLALKNFARSIVLDLLSLFSEVTCPELQEEFSNGAVKGLSNTYLAMVTFNCSDGFYITNETAGITQRVLTCQDNGQWNNTAPTCSRKYISNLGKVKCGLFWLYATTCHMVK